MILPEAVFRCSILTMPLNYFSLAESPRKRPETPPKPKKVGISQIASVVAEVYGSRLVAGPGIEQPTIPLQQKLLICTFLLMTKDRNTKEVVLGKVGFEFQVTVASFRCLQTELGYLLCNFLSVDMLVYYQLTLVQYVRQHLQSAVVVSQEIQIEMS